MSNALLRVLVPLIFLSPASPAVGSSSGWIETEGGRVRLLTTGAPDAEGKLRGALEIALKAGWKTYWRDPGEAGIPPSMDLSDSINVSGAEIGFPPPRRFDDGYSVWAGYDRPVSLPVTFTIGQPDRFTAIYAKLFLGICETICIPVQGEISLDPASDPDNPRDAASVEAAFAALPSPARPGFGIAQWRREADMLVAEAELPPGATGGELFLAGGGERAFGTPVRSEKNGRIIFEAPILGWPAEDGRAREISYVLVTDQGAVAGVMRDS